jgi:hypothetical protein
MKQLAVLIYFILCTGHALLAQADTAFTSSARRYVQYIDSVNKLDYAQDKGFISAVTDGIIKANDEVVGGYGIYTLASTNADTVYRIEYHDNYPINTYRTYYFKNNKLIYAKLELMGGGSFMKSIYLREEYYNNDTVTWSATRQEKSARKYYRKTEIVLLQDALTLQAEFMKDNTAH